MDDKRARVVELSGLPEVLHRVKEPSRVVDLRAHRHPNPSDRLPVPPPLSPPLQQAHQRIGGIRANQPQEQQVFSKSTSTTAGRSCTPDINTNKNSSLNPTIDPVQRAASLSPTNGYNHHLVYTIRELQDDLRTVKEQLKSLQLQFVETSSSAAASLVHPHISPTRPARPIYSPRTIDPHPQNPYHHHNRQPQHRQHQEQHQNSARTPTTARYSPTLINLEPLPRPQHYQSIIPPRAVSSDSHTKAQTTNHHHQRHQRIHSPHSINLDPPKRNQQRIQSPQLLPLDYLTKSEPLRQPRCSNFDQPATTNRYLPNYAGDCVEEDILADVSMASKEYLCRNRIF